MVLVGNEKFDHNLIRLGQSEFEASDGWNGKSGFMHKRRAPDLVINVPTGTSIFKIDKSTKEWRLLDEILIHDQWVIVANGGVGGLGNLDPNYWRDWLFGKEG